MTDSPQSTSPDTETMAASVESANLVTLHHWNPMKGWNEETELTDQEQTALAAALRGHAQGPLDRKGAAAAAEAICDYTDNNLSMMDACDMDTSKAQELYEAAKRLRDMLAPSDTSTDRGGK